MLHSSPGARAGGNEGEFGHNSSTFSSHVVPCKHLATTAFAQALLPHPRCAMCLYHPRLRLSTDKQTPLLPTARTAYLLLSPLPTLPQAAPLRVILLRGWDEESPGHRWTDTISSPICPYSPVVSSPAGI